MRTRIAAPPAKPGKAKNPHPGRHPTYRRILAPSELPPPSGKTPEQLLQEARAVEQAVAQALAGGFGARTVARLIKEQPEFRGIDHEVVWQSINRVVEEWETMYEEEAKRERPRAVARLRNDLARMRSREHPPWNSIARHEEMLGRIFGIFAPQKIEVDVFATMRQSLAAVIVDLSPDEADAIVAEQLELETRARLEAPVAAE